MDPPIVCTLYFQRVVRVVRCLLQIHINASKCGVPQRNRWASISQWVRSIPILSKQSTMVNIPQYSSIIPDILETEEFSLIRVKSNKWTVFSLLLSFYLVQTYDFGSSIHGQLQYMDSQSMELVGVPILGATVHKHSAMAKQSITEKQTR